MNILGIPFARFIIFLISFFIVAKAFYLYFLRVKSYTVIKTATIVFIWAGIGIVALFPDIAYYISRKLGFGENLNTLIFLGFIVVFVLIFRILRIIESIEKAITEIVRKEALKKISKPQKRK